MDIGETVLARNADVSLPIFPWVLAVILAAFPAIARRCQDFYLSGKMAYLVDFPLRYLVVVVDQRVELTRDSGKMLCHVGMTLSHVIVAV